MLLKLKILKYLSRYRKKQVPDNEEALIKWQNKKIKRHLKRIAKKSPFYAERLKKYGSWDKFPVINKEIFMENFDSINTHGIKKEEAYKVAIQAEESRDFSSMLGKVTVGLSSGTSGNRGIFLASVDERAQWVAYVLLHVLGWQWKQRKVAFFLRANSNLYSAAKSKLIDFNFFDLKNPIADNLEKLNSYQPDVIVAQPSMLIQVAKAQKAGRIKIQPKKIISVAEVLEAFDHSLLKRTFNQVIHQTYQCTEGFLAKTCEYGTLHFNEDIVKIEKRYLDAAEERYHPIITDFTRSSQPIIRYELNDIIIDKKEPCPCGSIFQAIDHIEGRADDVFLFKNKKGEEIQVFPDFIRRAIILASTKVQEYIVVQTSPKELIFYLDTNDFDNAKQDITKSILELLAYHNIQACKLIFKDSMPPNTMNKLRRIKRSF